jgi:hypothetical protein
MGADIDEEDRVYAQELEQDSEAIGDAEGPEALENTLERMRPESGVERVGPEQPLGFHGLLAGLRIQPLEGSGEASADMNVPDRSCHGSL